MDERDFEPEEPRARSAVDQLCATGGKLAELGLDVVGLEGDVMHAGPAAREEAAYRRILLRRRQELDPARTDSEVRGFDALLLEQSPVLEPRSEQAPVRLYRGVEIGHRNANMMDAA
jgi:hypothetical protein